MSKIIKVHSAIIKTVSTTPDGGFRATFELTLDSLDAAKELMRIKADNKAVDMAIQECD